MLVKKRECNYSYKSHAKLSDGVNEGAQGYHVYPF